MVCQQIRNTLLSCALLFSLTGFSATGQSQDKKSAHLAGSNPVSGLQLYKRYCAVCHGNDLKGNGPVSPEFKNPPADLTTLAQRHEGKFPDEYVQRCAAKRCEKTSPRRYGDADMGTALRHNSRHGFRSGQHPHRESDQLHQVHAGKIARATRPSSSPRQSFQSSLVANDQRGSFHLQQLLLLEVRENPCHRLSRRANDLPDLFMG